MSSPAVPIMDVLLRAATPQDDEFLLHLFAETQDQLSCFRSNQALWNSLVTMQYKGREMTYATQYPDALNSIICVDHGAADMLRVGRLLVDRQPDHWRIVDIAILATYRNRGVGTWALKQCIFEGRNAAGALRLRVTHGNPAQRLYTRLGFRETAHDDLGIEMACQEAGILASLHSESSY